MSSLNYRTLLFPKLNRQLRPCSRLSTAPLAPPSHEFQRFMAQTRQKCRTAPVQRDRALVGAGPKYCGIWKSQYRMLTARRTNTEKDSGQPNQHRPSSPPIHTGRMHAMRLVCDGDKQHARASTAEQSRTRRQHL